MFDEHDDSINGLLPRIILRQIDDTGQQQLGAAEGILGQIIGEAVRLQHYGFTNVPPAGSEGHLLTPGGRADRAVLQGLEHPASRPRNLKPGESQHYDDQGQNSHIARDGHYHTAKQHVMTAGDKPDTTHELNEQLKGLGARMAQAEHNLHGLFDVTSRLRQIAQQTIPALAELAPILNQDPSGLPLMAQAIEGKVQAYLQQQVQQAFDKFLNPNLAGLTSLLGGGVEGLIANLESQISDLVGQNPIVATVDALADELAAVTSSGGPVQAVTQRVGELQASIAALTSANPIVGTVAGLRNTLQGLVDQAGPGLNFLAPQQRLVQGLTKSLRLAKVA